MVSSASQRTKHSDYQIPLQKGLTAQKTGLTSLSPKLLMKIASHTLDSFVSFRLTCKKIDAGLAEASVRAFFDTRTLQLQTNNSPAPFVFPNSEKFSRLEEIAVELSGQAKEQTWEERLPQFKTNIGLNGYLPCYSKLTKICFDQHIQFSNNLIYQLIINSSPSENTHLTTIDFQNCSNVSNEALVNMFKSLPQLQRIKLGKSNLTNPRDCYLKLAELKSLTLIHSPNLTNLFLERILQAAPQLEEFEISHCWQVSGHSLGQISNTLRSLTVRLPHFNRLYGESPVLNSKSLMDLLERNKELVKIDLCAPSCSLIVNSSKRISFNFKYANLRQLVFNIDIDSDSDVILHLPTLEELTIKDVYQTLSENFKVVDGLPNLKKIIVDYGCDLSNSMLISLTSKSSQLEEMALYTCPMISGQYWDQINLQNLTRFTFDDNSEEAFFTPKDFGNLARGAPHLSYVNLHCWEQENQSIDDASFGNLEGTLSRLKDFFCYSLNGIDNSELLKIIQQAKKIEIVVLFGFKKITDICVLQFLHNCQNLKRIHFTNCSKISDQMNRALDEFTKFNASRECQNIN